MREVRVREQGVVLTVLYCCTGLNHHIWKYETFDHYMSPKTSKLRIAKKCSIMSAYSESDISSAITAFQSGKSPQFAGGMRLRFVCRIRRCNIASLGVFRHLTLMKIDRFSQAAKRRPCTMDYAIDEYSFPCIPGLGCANGRGDSS